MLSLFRSEWIKIKTSKSLKVLFFVIIGLQLFTAILMSIFTIDVGDGPAGRSNYASAFDFANNVGIAIPIVLAMYLSTEFSFGTIRNKIISGKSRTKIYFVNLITTLVLGFAFLIFNAILAFFMSFIFFKYGKIFDAKEVGMVLKITLIGCVMFVTFFSVLNLLAMVFKKLGLSIVFYIVFVLAISMSSIIFMLSSNDFLQKIYDFTPMGQSAMLMESTISYIDILKTIISTAVISTGVNAVGVMLFNRLDIK